MIQSYSSVDFPRAMFRLIHSRRIPEPEAPDINTLPGAITAFRNCTGMNREYLASRLFVTHTQLVNLESRGRPLTLELLVRLRELSHEYRLPVLETYFDKEQKLYQFRKKMKKQTTGLE